MGNFTEADIKTKYILPAIKNAGWDVQLQVREEVSFTQGRIIVRGKMAARGTSKRADYILIMSEDIIHLLLTNDIIANFVLQPFNKHIHSRLLLLRNKNCFIYFNLNVLLEFLLFNILNFLKINFVMPDNITTRMGVILGRYYL